ncbi:TerD family protein [Streptomyces sp. URMC 123]|uniref:TerD family protein n=1 Tax=Streptomyces sp. URMC 123 TaxID=3423403 RepID=UPI003F1A7D08
MQVELVRGQNHPLSVTRLEIRVSAGTPVVAVATLADDRGAVRAADRVAHPGAPSVPGLEVPRRTGTAHRVPVDLGELPDDVHRLHLLLALPDGPGGRTRFGATAAPHLTVLAEDGTEVAGYTAIGLDAETAVVALEFYRRQGAWKVRAVGQGYADGLAAHFREQGLADPGALAETIREAAMREAAVRDGASRGGATREEVSRAGATGDGATREGAAPDRAATAPSVDYRHPRRAARPEPRPGPSGRPQPSEPPQAPQRPERAERRPGEPAVPVAGDAAGWTPDERLYNQVWGMFEDLARTTAAFRGAVDFADGRREQELDRALSDPRGRFGPAADAARTEAEARHGHLVEQARAALDRDLAQLTAEAEVVEPALPPAFARWDSPVWQGYRVPMEIPMALRLGDLSLPERPDLRIPMLVRLPLERGLWIDSGCRAASSALALGPGEARRLAMDTAVLHAARLLAVYPAGEFTVHVIDPAGSAAPSLAPLLDTGALCEAPAAGAGPVAALISALTQRVDLAQMAVRGGAADALPADFDVSERLLVVNDFPHGFDDRTVNQLRYLADEGPAVGVHLMMVADREDARGYGPVLDPLWRALLRITPVPDDHLADPWVGHAWTYEPPRVPDGSAVLRDVLRRVAASRQAYGR